jgi:hypothetical protein
MVHFTLMSTIFSFLAQVPLVQLEIHHQLLVAQLEPW